MFLKEVYLMATTGELRAIIEELQLIDIGDAASYLGEEAPVLEASPPDLPQEGLTGSQAEVCGTPCTDLSFR